MAKYLNKILTALSLSCISLSTFGIATDVNFSYAGQDKEIFGYGYSRSDTYEICMLVKDPALTGGLLKSMSVPIPAASGCAVDSNAKVWITSTLTPNPIEESGLLYMQDVKTDGESVSADFPAGLTLPESGLYIGYTLTVTEIPAGYRKYPISVVEGNKEGSLYFRTPESKSTWDETYNRAEYMSAMNVTIEKNMPQVSVTPVLSEDFMVAINAAGYYPLTLINRGVEDIQNFSYILTVDEIETRGQIEIGATPDNNSGFGGNTTVEVPFDVPTTLGTHNIKIDITEVNGKENVGYPSTANAEFIVAPYVPKYRPIVDEYTGFTCGNCPSGWVAMEECKDKYGDDFIFICYHSGDALSSGVQSPYRPPYVPALSINRSYPSPNVSDVYEVYPAILDNKTDAGLEINLYWTNRNRSSLKADVDVCFMRDYTNTKYQLELILVADGLSDPSWAQYNYYSGALGKTGKYWDIFTKGGSRIYGLTYNSVPAINLEYDELKGMIPANITAFEPHTLTGVFNMANGISSKGVNLVADRDKLRVIAILTDTKTGQVVNAISSPYSLTAAIEGESNGVEEVDNATAVVETVYYNLSGLKIKEISKGEPYVKVTVYADGKTEAVKILN